MMETKEMMLSLLASVLLLSECSASPYYGYGNKNPDQGTTCNAVADIVFLYDASGSIVTDSNNVFGDPQENFNKMKQFMSNVVDEFSPVGPTGAQFAALCFSTEVVDHFYLNEHDSAQGVKDAITAFVTSPNQRTSIGKGLKQLQDNYFLSSNGGKRDCAKEFVILLTDGKHNEGNPLPVPVAQELKDDGVIIITVGIGNGTDDSELEAIASVGFKFDVDNFSTLSEEIDAIVQTACAAVECTSQTGGDNTNGMKTKKHRYVKNGVIININFPVNLSPLAKQPYGFGRKNPFAAQKYNVPSYGQPHPNPIPGWYNKKP